MIKKTLQASQRVKTAVSFTPPFKKSTSGIIRSFFATPLRFQKEVLEEDNQLLREKEAYYLAQLAKKEFKKNVALNKEKVQDLLRSAERRVDEEMGETLESQLQICQNVFNKIVKLDAPLSPWGGAKDQDEDSWLQTVVSIFKKSRETKKDPATTTPHDSRRQRYKLLQTLVEEHIPKLIEYIDMTLNRYKQHLGPEYDAIVERLQTLESSAENEEAAPSDEQEAALSKQQMQLNKLLADHKRMQRENELADFASSIDIDNFSTHAHQLAMLIKDYNLLSALFIQLFYQLGSEISTVYLYREYDGKQRLKETNNDTSGNYNYEQEARQELIQDKLDVQFLQTLAEKAFSHVRRMAVEIPSKYNNLMPNFVRDDFELPANSTAFWNNIIAGSVELRDQQLVGRVMKEMQSIGVRINTLTYRYFVTLLVLCNQPNQIQRLIKYMQKTGMKPDSKTIEILLKNGYTQDGVPVSQLPSSSDASSSSSPASTSSSSSSNAAAGTPDVYF